MNDKMVQGSFQINKKLRPSFTDYQTKIKSKQAQLSFWSEQQTWATIGKNNGYKQVEGIS